MQDCWEPMRAFSTARNGSGVPLCQRHLDMWLDDADDDPYLEPVKLRFFNAGGDGRVTGRHPDGDGGYRNM